MLQEHFWSLDATVEKLTPRLMVQVWDNDLGIANDDFLGEHSFVHPVLESSLIEVITQVLKQQKPQQCLKIENIVSFSNRLVLYLGKCTNIVRAFREENLT